MNSNDPYAGLKYLLLLGIFEAVLLGVAVICGIWLMAAYTLRNKGRPIAEKHFRLPKKILLFSLLTFTICFGLCSVWVYLPPV